MSSWLLITLFACPAAALKLPSEQIVTVHVDETILYQGKSNPVLIWVHVKEGYHIQANKVADEVLIPTTIEVAGDEKIIVRRKKFPAEKKFKLQGTDTFLEVYDGKFPIKLLLRPDPNAQTGKHALNAKIRYQACDSRTCLFPRVIEFSIPVEIRPKNSTS